MEAANETFSDLIEKLEDEHIETGLSKIWFSQDMLTRMIKGSIRPSGLVLILI